jgi:hypothetical protein
LTGFSMSIEKRGFLMVWSFSKRLGFHASILNWP